MRKKMTKVDIVIRVLAIVSIICIVVATITITTYAYPLPDSGTRLTNPPSYNDVMKVAELVEAQTEFMNIFSRTNTNQSKTFSFIGIFMVYEPVYAEPYKLLAVFQVDGNDVFINQLSEEWGVTRTANNNTSIPFNKQITYTYKQLYYNNQTGEMQIEWKNTSEYTKNEFTFYATGENKQTWLYMAEGKALVPGLNDIYSNWSTTTQYSITTAVDRWKNAQKALNGEQIGNGGYTQEDLDDAAQEGYNSGWEVGNAHGYTTGYTAGRQEGYDTGYDEGYDAGYNAGYNIGKLDGDVLLDVPAIITAIPNAASEIINSALGFEIFGINVAGTLLAILVVTIVAYVVKKVK